MDSAMHLLREEEGTEFQFEAGLGWIHSALILQQRETAHFNLIT